MTAVVAVEEDENYLTEYQRQIKGERVSRHIANLCEALSSWDIRMQRNALDELIADCDPRESYAGLSRAMISQQLAFSYEELRDLSDEDLRSWSQEVRSRGSHPRAHQVQ